MRVKIDELENSERDHANHSVDFVSDVPDVAPECAALGTNENIKPGQSTGLGTRESVTVANDGGE